jgi:DNA-binding transcriptional LysR family regulator
MEIRHLRYFLAIAEAGGFARAAVRLRVAQSALSRQIADLEEEMKVKLFDRSRRGVQLTYPGECFLQDARRMMADMERAQARAFDAQNGKVGSLTIGMVESFSWNDIITCPIYTFRRENPGVSLSLMMMNTVEQIAALREQKISAGIMLHRAPHDKALDKLVLHTDQLMLAVHKNSRFARHPPQRLAELADEEFFWFPRAANPSYYDEVIECCRSNGLSPRLTSGGMGHSASLSFVAAGLGCTFVVSQVRWRKPKNVAIVPVGDLKIRISLELVWHRENRQQALRNLIAAFQADRRGRSVPSSQHSFA